MLRSVTWPLNGFPRSGWSSAVMAVAIRKNSRLFAATVLTVAEEA